MRAGSGAKLPVVRYSAIFGICLTLVGLSAAKDPVPTVPAGAKIYVAPMEWNLDRFVTAEIQKQGLPVVLAARAEDADFVMTSLYQSLGSHFMSPGHYIQVKIVAAKGGRQVWFAEANDYALFFGRLRPHGPARVAEEVVRKLNRRMSASGR
jgi:hypothetical protein